MVLMNLSAVQDMWTRQWGGVGWMNWGSSMDICPPPCVRNSEWEPAVYHRKLTLLLCDALEGWDGGG